MEKNGKFSSFRTKEAYVYLGSQEEVVPMNFSVRLKEY